jgi:hypothetical protein
MDEALAVDGAVPPTPDAPAASSAPAYPRHWEADVVAWDGGVVHLRPILPGDADAIVDFHSRPAPTAALRAAPASRCCVRSQSSPPHRLLHRTGEAVPQGTGGPPARCPRDGSFSGGPQPERRMRLSPHVALR